MQEKKPSSVHILLNLLENGLQLFTHINKNISILEQGLETCKYTKMRVIHLLN